MKTNEFQIKLTMKSYRIASIISHLSYCKTIIQIIIIITIIAYSCMTIEDGWRTVEGERKGGVCRMYGQMSSCYLWVSGSCISLLVLYMCTCVTGNTMNVVDGTVCWGGG